MSLFYIIVFGIVTWILLHFLSRIFYARIEWVNKERDRYVDAVSGYIRKNMHNFYNERSKEFEQAIQLYQNSPVLQTTITNEQFEKFVVDNLETVDYLDTIDMDHYYNLIHDYDTMFWKMSKWELEDFVRPGCEEDFEKIKPYLDKESVSQ